MATARLYQGFMRQTARLLRPRDGTPQRARLSSGSTSPAQSPRLIDPKSEQPGSPKTPTTPTMESTALTHLPILERLGPVTRAFQAYGRAQRKRPYVVQVCSALVIYFFADVSSQRIRGKEYDPVRTARSLFIGAVAAIPAYRWFVWLSLSFNYSSKILSLATRVMVNQICFAPIFNTYFFGMQALLAGENLPAIWERIQRTVPVSVINSLKLWPAVSAFAFTYIPLEYRSIFVGFIAVGWQTYLAYLNRLAEEKAAAAGSPAVAAATAGA